MKQAIIILFLFHSTCYAYDSMPPDTLVLVSVNQIKAANAVKTMNDLNKQLIDTLTIQIHDLKSQILTQNEQTMGFKKIIENRNNALARSNTENYQLDAENKKLAAKLARKNKTVFIIGAIAVIKGAVIWFLIK